MADEFGLEGGRTEGGVSNRGAGGTGKEHAGEQRRLSETGTAMTDHGCGETHELVSNTRCRQQPASKQEEGDGKQQKFRDAGDGR